ncbi:MAG TPA: patatin-like phospholipase family protein [Pseudorhizobium sp.]|nr:patatin-like phospholipase family protein [Pseudorhizobium sp.]
MGAPASFAGPCPACCPSCPGIPSPTHVFDPSPLRQTLGELVDFGRLPDGPVRLLVTAVDGNGDDVTFDSHKGGIEVDHLLASAAFPIAFPPVSIDGRVYVDPGVSANLPIAPLFKHEDADNVLCLALDLVTAHGRVPKSLDDAVGRAQDLIFASQSRHALQRVIRSRNLSLPGKLAVLHLSYDGRNQ